MVDLQRYIFRNMNIFLVKSIKLTHTLCIRCIFWRFKLALPSLLFTSSTFITLVKSVQTSHQPTRAQSKKTILKAWNNIAIDFHQEMGQEYSTIVQVIVKADRRKAIAWRSVSCKMTCYYIPDVKTLQILSLHFLPTLQSIFCIRSAVCCLHFVLTGIRGTNTVYFWLHLFAQHT